jgi:iron(III) transport system ATP-binding protein
MEVVVRELNKRFGTSHGDVNALNTLSFDVKKGEFYTLLGPSGCGKSTTLRCIAGLERADGGEIRIGEHVVAAVNVWTPPNERPIGMVFQSYAIWPHMTVYKNVEFPLRQRRNRVPKKARRDMVMEVLALVQMEALADRPAPFLSGGQQQRVALARALVSRPDVLLLDEPLSNLDAKLREELRVEIKELTRRLGITAIYVTHDQVEALAMSDRIAVMQGGRILQEGSPKDIYLRPETSFVAQFVGQVNFFSGAVSTATQDGYGVVETPQGRLRCNLPAGMAPGVAAMVAVRPEAMTIASTAGLDAALNEVEGEIEKAIFLGDIIDCQVQVGTESVRARTSAVDDVTPGKRVWLRFTPDSCVVLPGRTSGEPEHRQATR